MMTSEKPQPKAESEVAKLRREVISLRQRLAAAQAVSKELRKQLAEWRKK